MAGTGAQRLHPSSLCAKSQIARDADELEAATMVVGAIIGAAFGVIAGALMDNIALGIAMGGGLGVAFALLAGGAKVTRARNGKPDA